MSRSLFSSPWLRADLAEILAQPQDAECDLSRERSVMSQLIIQLLDQQRVQELSDPELYTFYAFCQKHLARTHSQIYQDLWVLFMLNEKRGGYFVEFGACDGVLLSNTLLLEREYGWTGILAEPNPLWHEALSRNRSCRVSTECVFAASGENAIFASIPAMPELSRLRDIIPDDIHESNGNRSNREILGVHTISLLDLLRQHDAPRLIDYLSVDTEGSELAILQAFDFSAYRFRLISVEHAGDTPKREAIADLLHRHGYRRWRPELSRWDDWYVDTSVDAG